jgi:hypothetical protein
MGAGLALCLLALLLHVLSRHEPGAAELLLLTAGLLCAGTALAIRLSTGGTAFFDRVVRPSRPVLLAVLAGLFALLALAATAIVVVSFYDLPWFPWHTGMAVLVWLLVAPLATTTALRTLRLNRLSATVTAQEESAVMLVLSALCCFVACWTLYSPDDPGSWDTMRLPLAVFTAVALAGAPLALASTLMRRWTISVAVFLHFAGIVSATLSAHPAPWTAGQAWMRLFRPYLEFMYLNNAYHFYSPEPGPATYLWFRLIYVDHDGTDEQGEWYKIPDLDEKGRHRHMVALEYQRLLALTENVTQTDPTPGFFVYTEDGKQQVAPFLRRRQAHAPGPVRVGVESPPLAVPFHPFVPEGAQYSAPTAHSKRLLASIARHVAFAKKESPSFPGYTLKWVKIYRVRHEIPVLATFGRADPPMAANDPELYRPYYMGQFDDKGVLVDGETDPFLYWLLPILRDPYAISPPVQEYAASAIRDYARKHAGDPKWIRLPDRVYTRNTPQWVGLPDSETWVTQDELRAYFHDDGKTAR